MYPVSDAFLRAVRSNTRKYFWTGAIVTKGGMTYEFGAKEIVKGSGYISRQCCGSTEIELGTVYAAEMGITLLSDIDRYTLEAALVTLVFHLVLADGSVEDVPMGVFEVSEAKRLAKCLELKAYDFMLRFDKSFNGFETVGTAHDFIALCCKRCKVEFANKRAEIDAMPNGGVTLSVYTENDIDLPGCAVLCGTGSGRLCFKIDLLSEQKKVQNKSKNIDEVYQSVFFRCIMFLSYRVTFLCNVLGQIHYTSESPVRYFFMKKL